MNTNSSANLKPKRILCFGGIQWGVIGLIVALSHCAMAKSARADISVIVNSVNDVTLTESQINEIFLGKKTRFPNGVVAKTVDQPESSSVRKDFYSKLAKMDETAMKVYWSTLIFTGSAIPPKSLGNNGEVENFVKNNTGGLGYIDSSKPTDSSVRVIYVIK